MRECWTLTKVLKLYETSQLWSVQQVHESMLESVDISKCGNVTLGSSMSIKNSPGRGS